MGMVASGDLAQRLPCFYSHMAIGLGCQLQHHFAGVNVALDFWHALGDTFGVHFAVKFGQLLHLGLGIPANALAAIAHLVHQRTQRGEALKGIGVIALDHCNLGRRLAWNQLALATFPIFHVKGLGQLGRGVVHQRGQHHFLFYTQVTDADLAIGLGKSLVNVPVALGLPCRVHRSGQRVDKGMHVAGIEIIFLVPRSRGQHDVGIQASGAHAKVQRDQQVQLALRCFLMPLHFGRFGILHAQVLALYAVGGAQQMLHEVFMPFTGRTQQIGAPDKHIAWPVGGMVRVLAAHLQAAVL